MDARRVAIVGSRKADPSAVRFTRSLAAQLAAEGIDIVSGGALGIDTAAHLGALDGKGRTLAVLGSGLSNPYPEKNFELFEKIRHNGALVTEYSNDQPPTKWTFPKRNRIIAGLSDAVLVIQAAARSGALITARIARSSGIPVGAAPGLPGDPANAGNHKLIRGGAALIDGINDVLDLLRIEQKKSGQLCLPMLNDEGGIRRPKPTVDDPAAVKILEILCTRPLHIDDISLATGLLPSETSAAILALELQGLIEDRGGKNFVRVG